MTEFGTAILCTLHLSLGFAAASWMTRTRDSRRAILLQPALDEFHIAFDQATPSIARLPEPLQARAVELKSAVTKLADQVSATGRQVVPPSPIRNVPESPPSKPETPGPERRESARRYYPNEEFMTLLPEESSAIANFQRVTCHDLSATGVSFYLTRALNYDQLIAISLGSAGDATFMAAKVIYSRRVIVREVEQFRIGCRFIRRIRDHENNWKQQLRAA